MAITYLTGDATDPSPRPAIIAHVVNDIGAFGAGFSGELSRRWPKAEESYRASGQGRLRLGETLLARVDDDLWVAHLVAQRGLWQRGKPPPVRYGAMELALGYVADKAIVQEASVHMPRIGCGLAGGSWVLVEPIIERALVQRGIDVTVYDLGAK